MVNDKEKMWERLRREDKPTIKWSGISDVVISVSRVQPISRTKRIKVEKVRFYDTPR